MSETAEDDVHMVERVRKNENELDGLGTKEEDVGERLTERSREPMITPTAQLPRLAEDAQAMVRQALDAFVRGDAQLARDVIARDDSVDQQTEQSFRELLTYMLEDPPNISRAIRLTSAGKYFERMADGATTIRE